jgi:hypothetical protein
MCGGRPGYTDDGGGRKRWSRTLTASGTNFPIQTGRTGGGRTFGKWDFLNTKQSVLLTSNSKQNWAVSFAHNRTSSKTERSVLLTEFQAKLSSQVCSQSHSKQNWAVSFAHISNSEQNWAVSFSHLKLWAKLTSKFCSQSHCTLSKTDGYVLLTSEFPAKLSGQFFEMCSIIIMQVCFVFNVNKYSWNVKYNKVFWLS